MSFCSAAVSIGGKLHNISTYLRAYYTSPTARWNVLRYPLSSVFLFYWSIRNLRRQWGAHGYDAKHGGPVANDPTTFKELCDKVLIPKGLLLSVEAEKLTLYKGDKHKMLFSWALISLGRIMHTPLPKGELNNPYLSTLPEQTELMKNIKEEIVGLRGAFGSINNSLMFPIPFTYYHIVNTTVMTYLTILSWCFLYMSPGSQVITYDFMIFSGSHSQDLIFAKMMKLAVSNMIVHFLCAVCAVGLSFACFVHLFVSACVCSRAATGFLFLCIRSSASSFLDSKSWATTWRILLVSMMSTSTRRRLQTVTLGGVWKEEKRRDGREGDEGGSRGGTGRDGEGRGGKEIRSGRREKMWYAMAARTGVAVHERTPQQSRQVQM